MTLDLTIKPKRNKVITGESLPVEVTLENTSDAPVEVPDPLVGDVFRYTFTSKTDPGAVFYLSWALAQSERYQETPRSRGLAGKTLAPGAKEVYEEDLAEYEVPVLKPDAYELTVSYDGPDGLVESAGSAITIVPPHVARLVTLAGSGEQRIAVVFASPMDAKHARIYQIENAAGRPGDGAAYPRRDGVAIAGMGGVAVAIDVGGNPGRRWLGWEQAGSIGAGVGQGRNVWRLAAPIKHGLHDAALGPVGLQLTDDDALFIALGATDGKSALVAATFHLAAPGVVKTIPIVGPTKPDAWTAQYRGSGGETQIDLVTAEHAGRKVKITLQTIALGSGKVSPPTVLIERRGPLAVMAMAPVGMGDKANGVVDVLFGPDPKTGYVSFFRVPLAGGAPRGPWDFSAPKNAGGKRPTDWVLPRMPLSTPMAATHVGDKIYVRRAGGEWSVVVEDAAHVEHLSLEAFGEGDVVAVWSDPGFGIRYHAVP